jgi:hypothetical protein
MTIHSSLLDEQEFRHAEQNRRTIEGTEPEQKEEIAINKLGHSHH